MEEPTTAADTPLKVLLIEDEHFIGELYIRALSRAGYQAKVVIDGKVGLDEALTDQYDIIMLDYGPDYHRVRDTPAPP